MARSKDKSITGRVGDRIHSSWHGRPYTRAYPESVSNPQTEAQQAHRNAFANLSRLASYMKAAHAIGLYDQAIMMKLNTYCAFKKINKRWVTDHGISYSEIEVSKGSLSLVRVTAVTLEGPTLRVDFNGSYVDSKADAADKFYLFAYCLDLCAGELSEPVLRGAGTAILVLPDDWQGRPFHLYCFLSNAKMHTSNTLYVELDQYLK